MSVGSVTTTETVDGVPVVSASANSSLGQDAFLQLLTVQLANQDPMNPMSNEEFISQQAQFTQLEQSIELNDNMEAFMENQEEMMTGMTYVLSTLQSSSFLGQTVDYLTDEVQIEDGTATDLKYNLTTTAMFGYTVQNENGNIVRTIEPEQVAAGKGISIGFDGKDEFGQALPDGTYTVSFNVTDLDGNELTGTTYAQQRVTAIDFRTGAPEVKLANGEVVSMTKILAVSEEVDA